MPATRICISCHQKLNRDEKPLMRLSNCNATTKGVFAKVFPEVKTDGYICSTCWRIVVIEMTFSQNGFSCTDNRGVKEQLVIQSQPSHHAVNTDIMDLDSKMYSTYPTELQDSRMATRLDVRSEDLTSNSIHHLMDLVKGLNTLREKNIYCDVSLMAKDGGMLPAHAAVLAACSPRLFHSMQQGRRMLPVDVSSLELLEGIVTFMYTGELNVKKQCITEVSKISKTLGLNHLRDICEGIAKNNNDEGKREIKESGAVKELTATCNNYALAPSSSSVPGVQPKIPFQQSQHWDLRNILSNVPMTGYAPELWDTKAVKGNNANMTCSTSGGPALKGCVSMQTSFPVGKSPTVLQCYGLTLKGPTTVPTSCVAVTSASTMVPGYTVTASGSTAVQIFPSAVSGFTALQSNAPMTSDSSRATFIPGSFGSTVVRVSTATISCTTPVQCYGSSTTVVQGSASVVLGPTVVQGSVTAVSGVAVLKDALQMQRHPDPMFSCGIVGSQNTPFQSQQFRHHIPFGTYSCIPDLTCQADSVHPDQQSLTLNRPDALSAGQTQPKGGQNIVSVAGNYPTLDATKNIPIVQGYNMSDISEAVMRSNTLSAAASDVTRLGDRPIGTLAFTPQEYCNLVKALKANVHDAGKQRLPKGNAGVTTSLTARRDVSTSAIRLPHSLPCAAQTGTQMTNKIKHTNTSKQCGNQAITNNQLVKVPVVTNPVENRVLGLPVLKIYVENRTIGLNTNASFATSRTNQADYSETIHNVSNNVTENTGSHTEYLNACHKKNLLTECVVVNAKKVQLSADTAKKKCVDEQHGKMRNVTLGTSSLFPVEPKTSTRVSHNVRNKKTEYPKSCTLKYINTSKQREQTNLNKGDIKQTELQHLRKTTGKSMFADKPVALNNISVDTVEHHVQNDIANAMHDVDPGSRVKLNTIEIIDLTEDTGDSTISHHCDTRNDGINTNNGQKKQPHDGSEQGEHSNQCQHLVLDKSNCKESLLDPSETFANVDTQDAYEILRINLADDFISEDFSDGNLVIDESCTDNSTQFQHLITDKVSNNCKESSLNPSTTDDTQDDYEILRINLAEDFISEDFSDGNLVIDENCTDNSTLDDSHNNLLDEDDDGQTEENKDGKFCQEHLLSSFAPPCKRKKQEPAVRNIPLVNDRLHTTMLYPGCKHYENTGRTNYMAWDIAVGPYVCKPCSMMFTDKVALQNHQRWVHPDTVQKSKAKSHIQTCKPTLTKRSYQHKKPFSCTMRSAAFEHKCGNKVPMRSHRKRGVVKCHICNLKGRQHGDETNHLCSVCGKKFKFSSSLKMHEQYAHRTCKSHACSQCDASFRTRSFLRDHMLSHNGISRYSCKHCGKKYSTKMALKFHKCVAKAKQQYCKPMLKSQKKTQSTKPENEVCHQQATEQSVVTKHQQATEQSVVTKHQQATEQSVVTKHHTDTSDQSNLHASPFLYRFEKNTHLGDIPMDCEGLCSDKQYVCFFCDQRFNTEETLQHHRQTHIGHVQPYYCVCCPLRFHNAVSLNIHMESHAKVFKHECEVCHQRFKFKKELSQHRYLNHTTKN